MTQYINKDDLLAKIDNLKHKIDNRYSYSNGWKDALCMLEAELDTLEVKEVDLKKELELWMKSNADYTGHFNILEFTKYFFELGLKINQKGK